MGRARNKDNQWVRQSEKETTPGTPRSAALLALEAKVPDAEIDALLLQLHALDPEREDWSLQVLAHHAHVLDELAETMPDKRNYLFSVMGKRIPARMAALFGPHRVATLRTPDMKPFDKQIPKNLPASTPVLPKGLKSYALHRLVTEVEVSAGTVAEGSPSYCKGPEAYENMTFKEFLSSCPELGELDLDRKTLFGEMDKKFGNLF